LLSSLFLEDPVTVAELMQRSVKTVRSDASIAELVVSLADAHVSGLPVVDGSGRVIGVVSTTDVLTAEAEVEGPGARRELLEDTEVLEIMTPHPLRVAPSEDVREAARQMLYADVHRLLVIEDERVIGVISTTDIVRAVANGKL
jgi:CBS domain-containing protein